MLFVVNHRYTSLVLLVEAHSRLLVNKTHSPCKNLVRHNKNIYIVRVDDTNEAQNVTLKHFKHKAFEDNDLGKIVA